MKRNCNAAYFLTDKVSKRNELQKRIAETLAIYLL